MNEAIKQLNLGTLKNEVITSLGEPKKTINRDQYEILQYGSIAPSLADLLYFDNGVLVLKEMSAKKDNLVLNDLIALYGNPSARYGLYSDEFKDSFSTTVFSWFEQGIDAMVFGEAAESEVLNVRYFAAINQVEYESTFGKLWAERNTVVDANKVVVKNNEVLQMSKSEVQAIQEIQNNLALEKNKAVISGFAVALSLLLVVVFIIIWRKNKIKQSKAPSLPELDQSSPQT